MNTSQIHQLLSSIEEQAILIGNIVSVDGPINSVYLPSIRENVRVARLTLNEKQPDSLLTHITSLIVAERETILRAADMYFQTTAYDEHINHQDRTDWVVKVITDMEARLRQPQG